MNEDDLKWVTNGKNTVVIINQFLKKRVLKPLDIKELSHPSEMQNDASMHRDLARVHN